MKPSRILFIHGFASSGAYKTADTLRILFRPCEVLAPDVPISPDEALPLLQQTCQAFQPDLIVGLSLGGFWALQLRGFAKVCINPDLHVSRLLRTRIGENDYLSPRKDGATSFCVTEADCEAFEALELRQFDSLDEWERNHTAGLFASEDEIVRCHDEFALHYPQALYYPGGHLPTFPQLKKHLVPLVEQL